jgi:hypothetical protein
VKLKKKMEKARDAQYRELAERIERQTKLDTAARLLQTERLLQVCLMCMPCFFRVSVPGLATPAHRRARKRLGHARAASLRQEKLEGVSTHTQVCLVHVGTCCVQEILQPTGIGLAGGDAEEKAEECRRRTGQGQRLLNDNVNWMCRVKENEEK